jgi:hypothetical protein
MVLQETVSAHNLLALKEPLPSGCEFRVFAFIRQQAKRRTKTHKDTDNFLSR